ncbi:hypothetical protein PENANT_c001G11324 [Penicillium antarcticum]|uniref:Transglutaminase-like domain-containing protein n=1 Tax=Penicillium antarcticum TaxID=416450 RepID=A0A1V6QN59_9EURO|nr:uncharacterized protein N7508_010563 [Penicillium antarcticum]KAJ5295742.1 hypothetical protein N7508_010563 [Penicillium antarcticum]OQD90674.1 hypothetical protein PENANT_c001G11324 [Penicillium antarcticum]
MTEEPQLNSIQQRIAALNQSQLARPPGPEPFLRPTPERSVPISPPPSYDSVVSPTRVPSRNEQSEDRSERPVLRPPPMETLRPDLKPKPKPPPPLPTRRSDRQAPPTPPARPSLPPRRPTDRPRRPSLDSTTSDASYSTNSTATTAGRNASSTSVNSNGNNRIKAPAWGATELPALPPKRPKEQVSLEPPPRPTPTSKRSFGNLSSRITSKINLPGSKPAGPSPPNQPRRPSPSPRPSIPSRPSLPTRPQTNDDAPTPQLPRQPSGVQSHLNGAAEDEGPALPVRRTLPPPPSASRINDARQLGFGNKSPSIPAQPSSTPAHNPPGGTPPPIPHGSRPDLSKIMATKPRFNGSSASASPPAHSSDTECLVCRDFSGPDNHAARYPRASLPTQDMAWLANELTAPFPSLTDKARAIFTWLHHNIFYDVVAFFGKCVQPSTPASTLATGLAVCEGYAGLFLELATKGGLEAIKVGGHGKGFSHSTLTPSSPVPPFDGNHAWNAVKIDGGRWKLIDTCWGAGCIEGEGKPYKQRFEPAMFSIPNEEFGLKHFPSNANYFFREDGRPNPTWQEYILTDPERPNGVEHLKVYSDADKRSIGRKTIQPAALHISVSTPGPMRFSFGLLCPHWTLARHSHNTLPGLFLLMIHGVDGRKDDRLPFRHVLGSGPAGGGEMWYVDVPEARMLGAPGQKLQLAVLTSFDNQDAVGVTADEFLAKNGRVGMAWAYVAEWELVR